jgi:hypothetical protein
LIPRLRDALTRECENVVLKLEAWVVAASPRPPSWAIEHTEMSAGVLGETALPGV